jgi:ABC-type nitrate/sulfonate/bicarbonate transport system ATPase subunit
VAIVQITPHHLLEAIVQTSHHLQEAIVQITHHLQEATVQTSHHLQEAVQIKNLIREIPFRVMAANQLTQIMMIIAEVQQLISQKDQIINHF